MQINKVLITNDDGYNSFGIKLLSDILKQFANEIYVVAPRNNKSGSSRSISLKVKRKLLVIFSMRLQGQNQRNDCNANNKNKNEHCPKTTFHFSTLTFSNSLF